MGFKIQRVESKRVDAFAEMTDEELDAYLAGRRMQSTKHQCK